MKIQGDNQKYKCYDKRFQNVLFHASHCSHQNEQGRIVTPATLVPSCEVSVEQVFQMITCNENLKILTEQVRNSGDIRTAKASLLPYVTPVVRSRVETANVS